MTHTFETSRFVFTRCEENIFQSKDEEIFQRKGAHRYSILPPLHVPPSPREQGAMTTELVESLYADSALLLKLPPGDNTAFHIKPHFVALEDAKAGGVFAEWGGSGESIR